jgi:hypothetical protein
MDVSLQFSLRLTPFPTFFAVSVLMLFLKLKIGRKNIEYHYHGEHHEVDAGRSSVHIDVELNRYTHNISLVLVLVNSNPNLESWPNFLHVRKTILLLCICCEHARQQAKFFCSSLSRTKLKIK